MALVQLPMVLELRMRLRAVLGLLEASQALGQAQREELQPLLVTLALPEAGLVQERGVRTLLAALVLRPRCLPLPRLPQPPMPLPSRPPPLRRRGDLWLIRP